ncbi:acyl-CoA mutase large subunit family protein [Ornithinimicrobium avium]|uniref:Methylmalonyl-CoA mutase n=1 Tax=Ornithinimicrobium avium TaxID=2283195 RepID=A0A345NNR4_9MICO|nr:methylmalonyl-CoA mutase family protein [Ornithinimicrobium avium]AXH96672.1 methylmalonyl-CoA mutase [Ornithinimicrobium avium]
MARERAAADEPQAQGTEAQPVFSTQSGVPIQERYGPEALQGWDPARQLGEAGSFPYTRGPYPTMYRSRLWTHRQVVGLGTAQETNERNKYVIEHGQTGLSNDYDVPTLIGLDSDDERARGEVGRSGVAIDTLRDMYDVFDGIDLENISVSMTINHPAFILVAQYIAAAQQRGFRLDRLAGTVQNDPLKDFYAQKTYRFSPRPSVRLAADLIEHCAQHMPRWNGISLNGYNIREAGSTADQELAFTFAHAIAYIEELLGRGLPIDSFVSRFSFIFNVHNDFLEEIAKLRAARRMWARLLTERFGARPESVKLRMHVQTGGSTMTYQQPEVNLIRGALQSMAGALGGVQSMAVSCFDEAYSIPSQRAQRLSLRTQQVVGFESGVTKVVDPFAGSYYVESLTDETERRADEWLARVDEQGGAIAAVENGWFERVISDTAHRQHLEVASGERVIVGVNSFEESEESEIETFRVGPGSEAAQLERLKEVRATRDDREVQRLLDVVQETAAAGKNLMPAVIDAVSAYATQGEITDRVLAVDGEYVAPAIY